MKVKVSKKKLESPYIKQDFYEYEEPQNEVFTGIVEGLIQALMHESGDIVLNSKTYTNTFPDCPSGCENMENGDCEFRDACWTEVSGDGECLVGMPSLYTKQMSDSKLKMELVWHNCKTCSPSEAYNDRLLLWDGETLINAEWDHGSWFCAGHYLDMTGEEESCWWADLEQTAKKFFEE